MISVGCDIDGTYLSGFRPPESEFIFISGRKSSDWADTIRQIGSDRLIYLRPLFFPGDSPHWKAAIIQQMRITKFYEDDLNQAKEIKRCCPHCQIVIIKDGQIIQEDFK